MATSTLAQRRKQQDPYAQAQARARRAANLSRQETLNTERSKAAGDPVRGVSTPFVESFDTGLLATPQAESTTNDTSDAATMALPNSSLNHFITADELQRSLQQSDYLSSPYLNPNRATTDPAPVDDKTRLHRTQHANAVSALSRIVSIANSSSADRTRINTQRCIETFGRHNTDQILKPRPRASQPMGTRDEIALNDTQTMPRAGPDTGSSEVQIAILTAKIRTLANVLEGRGRKDKVNKRNLRVLVHKRQKLLQYMRKKERGGERWQHLIQTLGLSEGTWQGEISL